MPGPSRKRQGPARDGRMALPGLPGQRGQDWIEELHSFLKLRLSGCRTSAKVHGAAHSEQKHPTTSPESGMLCTVCSQPASNQHREVLSFLVASNNKCYRLPSNFREVQHCRSIRGSSHAINDLFSCGRLTPDRLSPDIPIRPYHLSERPCNML